MTEQPTATSAALTPTPAGGAANLTRIRSVLAIAALATATVGVIVLLILLLSLYPSLRRTVQNLEAASAAAATATADFAAVSDYTAQNLADASADVNEAAANVRDAAEQFQRNSVDDSIVDAVIRLLREEAWRGNAR